MLEKLTVIIHFIYERDVSVILCFHYIIEHHIEEKCVGNFFNFWKHSRVFHSDVCSWTERRTADDLFTPNSIRMESLRADAELLPWINVCYVTDVRKSSQNSVYSLSLTFQHWSPAAKSSSGYLALSCRFCDIHTPSEPHDDYRLFPLNVFPVMKGTSSRRSL